MKPRLYIESSVISFEAARPARDIQLLAKQQLTHLFWNLLDECEPFISELVLQEIQQGDKSAAKDRLGRIRSMPILQRTPEVDVIAKQLLAASVLPEKSAADAEHIAVAAVHRLDYLLTWNMTHIAHPIKKQQILNIANRLACSELAILTPEEFLWIYNQ